MRRSWVIASGLLLWVGCTTSVNVGADGPGGAGGGSGETGSTASSSSSGSGDPCDGVACATPPAPECASPTTLRIHESTGACDAGACSYAYTDTVCTNGCSSGACANAPIPVPTALAVGGHVNCVALTDGVECWGSNQYGALGDGSTTDSHVPVAVVGLSSGVKAIASSESRDVCAINAAGGVECWGTNNHGALGNNSMTDSPVPVPVTGLTSGIVAIGLVDGSACAVTAAGALWCWGDNPAIGSTEVDLPIEKMDLPPVVAVTLGPLHGCALTSLGGVKCWGDNEADQIGNSAAPLYSTVPFDVVGLSSGVVAISTGTNTTCALLATGAVKCWGGYLILGNGSPGNNSPVPVDVVGLSSGVVAIDLGPSHGCALLATGAVKCWGANPYGQLGNNTSGGASWTPVDVTALSAAASAISVGLDVTCALLVNGKVECWGFNASGQLGNGTTTHSSVPVEVVGF